MTQWVKLAEEQGEIVRIIKDELRADPASHTKEELDAAVAKLKELVSGALPPKKDIQKHEIERLLRKFGFSVEDVVVAVVGASLERNERYGGCRQSLWVTRHRH
jgi:hypothetical protein